MVIAGINKGVTNFGMKLNDGGCCIIKDDIMVSIAEERVTRKKYASGYDMSLKYCLDSLGIEMKDVDYFVVSSCCENNNINNIKLKGIDYRRIIFCPSHHYSHACSAYYTSYFDEALVIVIDNEGNVLDDFDYEKPFHKQRMEHMSYYLANKTGISLIETDDVPIDKIGIGDAYRYFTHYLGFPSYEYAGKVMGLASYGNRDCYKDLKIFNMSNDGKIYCDIDNNYEDGVSSLKSFFAQLDMYDFPEPRTPIEDICQMHADLAYLIQRETEDILIKKINYLIKKTGVRKICLSGGVALNSVANGRILKECDIDDIYIFPAAGDSGQCIGNAIYGYNKMTSKNKFFDINNAYLGKVYSEDEISKTIIGMIDENEYEIVKYANKDKKIKEIARLIYDGKYIGYFDGGSEIGPRALGHRSILANPCLKGTKDDLNMKIKFRESFRPFAPMILDEYKNDYFDLDIKSPFMLLVADVKIPEKIPSVTHVDGTARIQTVNRTQNDQIYEIIKQFSSLSGVPVILNTSFNIAGEPIVETPEDAVDCFKKTNLDVLVIGEYIVRKKSNDYIEPKGIDIFVCKLGESLNK